MSATDRHVIFMLRAIALAKLGAGATGSNPMVGSVLVHQGRVIGEGYHRKFGEAHAEVNCLNDVKEEDRSLISESTLYVTLEPCSHFGKTPPCADLIIARGIKHVVVGSPDPFSQVNGKGIEKLLNANVRVETGVLSAECHALNKRFFTFHKKKRPYIILKWAQTGDRFISWHGSNENERLMITGDITNRLVHKWRSEEMAIMVGTNTARSDNPSLTNRLWTGSSPVRVTIDRNLSLPQSHRLFDNAVRTIVFNRERDAVVGQTQYIKIDLHDTMPATSFQQSTIFITGGPGTEVPSMLNELTNLQLTSVIVEGGSMLLQSFINQGCWDEARVITNTSLFGKIGVPSPVIPDAILTGSLVIGNELVQYFENSDQQPY